MFVLVIQWCPTLCGHMDCSPPGSPMEPSPRPWNSPGKNTGGGSHALLQGIFPTQGSDPGLLHWQLDSLPSEPPGERVGFYEPALMGGGLLTLFLQRCSRGGGSQGSHLVTGQGK